MLLGAYCGSELETLGKIVELQGRLKTRMPLVQIYTAWGDRAEHEFPYRSAIAIWNMGSVPVITWEPWLSVFDNVGHPQLPCANFGTAMALPQSAAGTTTSTSMDGQPVRPASSRPSFSASRYFPGDEYVDWVATGALNYGAIAYWSRWWTFDEIFGMKYQRLATFGKPIMIAELGSLGSGQERARWYGDALRSLLVRYPQVKAVLFFHTPGDQTVTYQRVDWTVIGDDALTQTIADAIRPYDRSRSGQ